MTYEKSKQSFDDETQLILEIATTFLSDYFGHPHSEAEGLIGKLLTSYPEIYDQDFIHRESSYGVAAAAHYLCALGGRPADFRDWMLETGHSRTPAEALEYFRKKYFL